MAETITLKNAVVNGTLTDVTVYSGKIIGIGRTAETANVIDINGNILMPGLIDIHSHGCIGYDTMDATEDEFAQMRRFYKQNGVTTWYPTTMTMSISDIERATNRDISHCDGANVDGFHMEGPYINEKYKGAQNPDYIKAPSIYEIDKLANVRLVTIAPELSGSEDFIRHCSKKGIKVALGHTDCGFDTALTAFEAGASCLTHTCNAMRPLLHREPGPIGAAICQGAYAQVICDGKHIHKAMILALYRMFGADRMVLISDSMRATGLGDGSYEFGGLEITVKDGFARTPDGALAGSTSTLYECVKCAIDFGIPAMDAFKMASETPAKLMGLKKGRLEVGYDAEFIVVDGNYELVDTIILN